jgi:iron complex outermembrane receptor protein
MKIYIFKLAAFFCCFIYSSSIFAIEEIPDVYVSSSDNPFDQSNTEKKPTPTLLSKSPIETITAKDIELSKAQTLDQLLQGKFGVQTNDLYGDGNHSNISMRGFGDNASYNTLILIDGQPISNPDTALPSVNFVPLSQIEQIDVMPSSGSVLYGDQAVGGVINITTKHPKETSRNITAEYGSFNARKINGMWSDKFKNGFGYIVNALHYDTDNYREHNYFQSNNINAMLSFDSENTQSYLHYWKVDNHMLLPNGLTAEQVAENRRQADSDIPFNNQNTDLLQFSLKQKLNENNVFDLKSYFENMTGVGAYECNDMPLPFSEKRSVINFTPSIANNFDFFNRSFFPTLGFEFNSGEYTYSDNSAKQIEKALFGQINTYLTSKLSVSAGARAAAANYDVTNQNGNNNPTDRANATDLEGSYAFTKNLRTFIKRADSFRFPKTDEQAWTLPGSPPLKTQTGTTYETGFELQKKYLSLLFEIYELDLKNEIMVVPVSDENYYGYNENIDPTKRRGFIINAEIPLFSKFKIAADESYVDAKFSSGDFSGNRIPFVAANTTRLAVIYQENKYFEMYIEGIYISSRYPANDLENKDNLLGGFTVYNLNLNVVKEPYTLGLKINNLSNKQYYSYVTTTYNANNSVSTMYYPAAGINAVISLSINF